MLKYLTSMVVIIKVRLEGEKKTQQNYIKYIKND